MSSELAAIQQQLDALQANIALRDLKSRYWRAIDQQDLTTVRDCLIPEAEIDMEGVGTMTGAEFIDFVASNGCEPGVFNLHSGQNPVITITDADNASGEWDMWFTSVNIETRHTIQMSGHYRDRYVKQGGRWKISAMWFRQSSFLMHGYDDAGKPAALSMGRDNQNAFGA